MKIGNKEYGFRLTVGASVQIAKLCPNGDLSRLSEAIGTQYGTQAEVMAEVISALSNGYAAAENFAGRKANRLTVADVLSLDPVTFEMLMKAAFEAFGKDVNGEIEVSGKKAAKEG